MKNLIKPILILSIVALVFQNCGKYEEGPGFSLRSKSARIDNLWVMEKEYENGEEKELSPFNSYFFLELKKDGTGKSGNDEFKYTVSGAELTMAASEINLVWELSENKEQIRTKYEGDSDWEIWVDIIRLTENEMWLKYTEEDGSSTILYELHYKTK
ncbi:MAG: hypothetical protein A2W91_16550 [Bacteroidetes bacterium GWF2_38_335]|nr:MAG: hypothetical protein A2W91_16550 [Bacteroidetes bacterium GWF2_38_335]OFY81298.1 MAG: hypothetical protein A2281_07525 [Bacteroidetes bacterium RIFOXYA12_FULL_38_20]HBS85418.1 hypothetical protein [Bacteroidales bacterium]